MRLIDADLFMQRIESYNTLDEMDKALYNFALHEIVCMPTVDVLEQIRAEIEKVFCMSVVTNELRTPMEVKTEILQIIDKHMAESGDKQ